MIQDRWAINKLIRLKNFKKIRMHLMSSICQILVPLPPLSSVELDKNFKIKVERCPGGCHGNPLLYSCLENPHGQKILVGYSSWGGKKSDKTEWLSTAQHQDKSSFLRHILEGWFQPPWHCKFKKKMRLLET